MRVAAAVYCSMQPRLQTVDIQAALACVLMYLALSCFVSTLS
jgi:hypothetical protein